MAPPSVGGGRGSDGGAGSGPPNQPAGKALTEKELGVSPRNSAAHPPPSRRMSPEGSRRKDWVLVAPVEYTAILRPPHFLPAHPAHYGFSFLPRPLWGALFLVGGEWGRGNRAPQPAADTEAPQGTVGG